MRTIFICTILLLGLSACSSKQLYHNAQLHVGSECKKDAINISQYHECLRNEENRLRYEEYERQRKQSSEEKSD